MADSCAIIRSFDPYSVALRRGCFTKPPRFFSAEMIRRSSWPIDSLLYGKLEARTSNHRYSTLRKCRISMKQLITVTLRRMCDVVSRSQTAIFAQTPPSQKTSFAKAGSEQRWRSGYARLCATRVNYASSTIFQWTSAPQVRELGQAYVTLICINYNRHVAKL